MIVIIFLRDNINMLQSSTMPGQVDNSDETIAKERRLLAAIKDSPLMFAWVKV